LGDGMMNKITLVMLLTFSINMVHAQEENKKPILVKEYPISIETNGTFYEPVEQAYEDFGLNLACDMSGRLYFFDYDKHLIHILDDKYFTIIKTYKVNPFPFLGRYHGDKNGIYYISNFGVFEYINYEGIVLFYGDLGDIINFTDDMRIESFYYHANVLFFMDNQKQIHSIINPGMNTEQNKINYRNPEQTKALFYQDSDFDLQGLRLDSTYGYFYLNDVCMGPDFYQVIGKWMYVPSSLGNDLLSLVVGNEVKVLIDNKIMRIDRKIFTPEGFTVHPSGDIYILRYDRNKKAHILLRFENTWDLEARKVWFKK
jgi:hypothetical protein